MRRATLIGLATLLQASPAFAHAFLERASPPVGLKQTLSQSDSFPITLSFAKAGPVQAIATVAKAGATTSSVDRGNMGGMPMQGKQP